MRYKYRASGGDRPRFFRGRALFLIHAEASRCIMLHVKISIVIVALALFNVNNSVDSANDYYSRFREMVKTARGKLLLWLCRIERDSAPITLRDAYALYSKGENYLPVFIFSKNNIFYTFVKKNIIFWSWKVSKWKDAKHIINFVLFYECYFIK